MRVKAGDRIVAVNDSQFGMYKAGDTGTFVRNPGARASAGIIIILDGRTCEVLRENWKAAEMFDYPNELNFAP